MDRVILHSDINNFYASVECLRFPEFQDKPLAVAGDPNKRHGIILAKNTIAKGFGIKTGEVIWQAKQKCPDLVCVPPHFDDYMRFSDQIFDIYTQYTSRVEPFGADECWLDVTGSQKLFGSGLDIAKRISKQVKEETGLTVSIGVSWNKIFAKLGSDYKKPDAITIIDKQNYEDIVFPLPCNEIMMVGRATSEHLIKMNIKTIGALAMADDALLKQAFGINGLKIKQYAQGLDTEPVREYYQKRVPESVGHGITTIKNLFALEDIRVVIFYLADMVAARMRKYNVIGSRVAVSLRDTSLSHLTRQKSMPIKNNSGTTIAETAFELAKDNLDEYSDKGLRTVTVSVFDLESADADRQLSMFETRRAEKEHSRDLGLDIIKKRFGSKSIERANLLGSDFIYDKNENEDFLPFKR